MLIDKASHQKITGWCLTSGGAGHEAQCLGLFDSLGIHPSIKRVNPQGWYKNLAPVGPAQSNPDIHAPWPDLLIVSGRQSLPYARFIKRKSSGKTFIAVLQKPGLPSSWFDFIWAPEGDGLRHKNVLSTLTPPNRLSHQRIADAKIHYEHLILDLPKPWVTVLVGGPSRSFDFGWEEMRKLSDDLITLHKTTGCSFLISPSYRTGKALTKFLSESLADIPAKIWNLEGENPFFGYLAWADYFIVTGDSVNMLGEAAFTGKPVYAYPVPYKHTKFTHLYEGLIKAGAMRWFNGSLEPWTYEPLNSTTVISNELLARFLLHQKKFI